MDGQGASAHSAAMNDNTINGAPQVLLANNADTNIKDPDGTTPLYVVALLGNGGVMRVLLGQGAGTQIWQSDLDPLLLTAAARSHLAIVRQLAKNGANPEETSRNGISALFSAVKAHLRSGLCESSQIEALI